MAITVNNAYLNEFQTMSSTKSLGNMKVNGVNLRSLDKHLNYCGTDSNLIIENLSYAYSFFIVPFMKVERTIYNVCSMFITHSYVHL